MHLIAVVLHDLQTQTDPVRSVLDETSEPHRSVAKGQPQEHWRIRRRRGQWWLTNECTWMSHWKEKPILLFSVLRWQDVIDIWGEESSRTFEHLFLVSRRQDPETPIDKPSTSE